MKIDLGIPMMKVYKSIISWLPNWSVFYLDLYFNSTLVSSFIFTYFNIFLNFMICFSSSLFSLHGTHPKIPLPDFKISRI